MTRIGGDTIQLMNERNKIMKNIDEDDFYQ